MSTSLRMKLLAACAAGFAPALFAGAQEAPRERALERLEVTMVLLPENAASDAAVTRRIELPPAARDSAGGKPPADLPGARNGKGPDNAAEARERGREFGQDVAEQARENRENAGQGKGPPEIPPGQIDNPGNGGRPDTPGRPNP